MIYPTFIFYEFISLPFSTSALHDSLLRFDRRWRWCRICIGAFGTCHVQRLRCIWRKGINQKSDDDLMALLVTALPYFKDLCGLRWWAYVLPVVNHNCVGLAFLEGVFRYSVASGPAKVPSGSLYPLV